MHVRGGYGSILRERGQASNRIHETTWPVTENIIRCKGIDAGRAYLRFREERFVTEPGDRGHAAELLESLDDQALSAFDSDTAASTKSLARKHRRAPS